MIFMCCKNVTPIVTLEFMAPFHNVYFDAYLGLRRFLFCNTKDDLSILQICKFLFLVECVSEPTIVIIPRHRKIMRDLNVFFNCVYLYSGTGSHRRTPFLLRNSSQLTQFTTCFQVKHLCNLNSKCHLKFTSEIYTIVPICRAKSL